MSFFTLGYRAAPRGFGTLLPEQIVSLDPSQVVKTASYQSSTSVSPGVVDRTVAAPSYMASYDASQPRQQRQYAIATEMARVGETATNAVDRASRTAAPEATETVVDSSVGPLGPEGSGTPYVPADAVPAPSRGLPWWAWGLIGLGGGLVAGRLIAG